MKSIITAVIATLFISLPVTVFAEGGYHWEKNAEKREMPHKMNMNGHMDHANSEHGSMMKGSSGMESAHAKSHSKDMKNMKPKHEGKDKK